MPGYRGRQRHNCDIRERQPTRATWNGICRVRGRDIPCCALVISPAVHDFCPHAEHTFPVCFALMSRKTTALYEAVFSVVQQLVPHVQPSQVIADFEEALATDARAVFGNDLLVSGC